MLEELSGPGGIQHPATGIDASSLRVDLKRWFREGLAEHKVSAETME